MLRYLIERLAEATPRRRVVIALVTLFVASALLTPQYNPLTRDYALGTANLSRVWNELLVWRTVMAEARAIEDGWPKDIETYRPPIDDPVVSISSPQPYRLAADIADRDELGGLAGKQVILDFSRSDDSWVCRPGVPPISTRYLPISCQRSGGESPLVLDLKWLVIICFLLFVIAGLLLLFRHPLLGPVQMRPKALLTTPLERLAKLDRLLGMLGRRATTLQAAGVTPSSWQQALACAAADGEARVAQLALKLGANSQPSPGWSLPGQVFEWRFTADLPFALDRCLVYLPAAGMAAEQIVHHLRAVQTGLDVMLVPTAEGQEELETFCADHANLFVALDSPSQTEWLLGRKPGEVLLRLLAAQLRLTRISPYQTRGGVVRADSFFGRAHLLARVLNREPSNYLVVGGRQLGKSSLLKAVQRRLQNHPLMVCHYISLRDHRLAPRLALQFGLPAETPLEQIIEHVVASHEGKRVFLLIDEADLFFRDEAGHGYPQLSTLRALSEEGRCWFMLAGFWDLYATAVLDYQSPLRNFGEVITIGGLEADACRELATIPLARLRLGFASSTLVDELVEASGQRANLVAIICQECLEAMGPGASVVERAHLTKALASQAVQDALAGWARLSHDENACRLDRIVVYHTAYHGRTSLANLVALIRASGRHAEVDALKHSLARLLLGFVLKRTETGYAFAVPLFARQFDREELRLLLQQELVNLSRASSGTT
jgi:hypothetical protein